MPEQILRVEVEGPVALVELTRPELLNRFDFDVHHALETALNGLARRPEVRAVVLASTGKHFSAGGDMSSILDAADDVDARWSQIDDGRRLFRAVADFSKPLIVALHGDCYGVATSLVLCADAIVAHPTAKLIDPHVHVALVAGDGGSVVWPMNMAMTLAKRHLLWGKPLLASDAYRLGIVTDLVESVEEVRERSLDIAQEVAALPPIAVQLTKRALNKHVHSRVDDVFDTGFYLEAITTQTEDVREAVAAFQEQRKPQWKGR